MPMTRSAVRARAFAAALPVDPTAPRPRVDVLVAAFNEATKKVDEMMAAEMGKLTSGLGLPPGIL